MSASYTIHVYDPMGVHQTTIINFVRLQLVRKLNEPGALVLDLEPDADLIGMLKADCRLEVWRTVWGHDSIQEGSYYLVRNISWGYSESGTKVLTIQAEDALALLRRRIYLPPADWDPDNSLDHEYLRSDNLIKQLMRESIGDEVADPNRDLSEYVSIDPDEENSVCPIGVVSRNAIARRDLLTVVKELCDWSWYSEVRLFIDIVGSTRTGLVFKTYPYCRGVNHGQFLGDPYFTESPTRDYRILSRASSSLTRASITYAHENEATVVYTRGPGMGSQALETYAMDVDRVGMSPFGRIERVADCQSENPDVDVIQAYAEAALFRSRPRRLFEGTYQETASMLYGVDFGFGDIIICQIDNLELDCHVDAVQIANENGVDRVEITCRSEGYF